MDPTTLMILIAAGLVVLMILFWIMGTYNRMVDLRNEVENQYQNLETQVGVKDQKVALVEQTDLAQLGRVKFTTRSSRPGNCSHKPRVRQPERIE